MHIARAGRGDRIRRVIADKGPGAQIEHMHAGIHADRDTSAKCRTGGDRYQILIGVRGDGDKAPGRRNHRARVDIGIGALDVGPDIDTDTGGAGATRRQRSGDTDNGGIVPRRHQHAREAGGHLRRSADKRRGRFVQNIDCRRTCHTRRPADSDAGNDRQNVFLRAGSHLQAAPDGDVSPVVDEGPCDADMVQRRVGSPDAGGAAQTDGTRDHGGLEVIVGKD